MVWNKEDTISGIDQRIGVPMRDDYLISPISSKDL